MQRPQRGASTRIALLALVTALVIEGSAPPQSTDLTEATLEDLMNMEVTSVSKKEQRLSQAPAAIYLITHEDIRRSGMTTMADLMRLVPGMNVGQIQGGAWAVSARGFNDNYSNKLLVLVDGRSVYSPTHAGVNWEAQDTLLKDVERIEVIRGPGATLWGANAVNGVINIITKPASETQGAFVAAGVGDQGQVLGGARFGGEVGKIGHYRAFTKYLHTRGLENHTAIYSVSPLPSLPVDAYARLDARLGYKLTSGAEISVSGENLQGRRHVEYLSVGPYAKATIGRSFIVRVAWSL